MPFTPNWRDVPPPTPLRPDGHALIVDPADDPLYDAAHLPLLNDGPLPALTQRRVIGGVEMVAATFLWEASLQGAPEAVLLHLNTLTDRNRTALEASLLMPLGEGRFGRTLWLPTDGVFSYGFFPLRLSELPGLRADPARWLEVRRAAVADARNPRRVRNGVGNSVSLWTGPRVEVHPEWEASELAGRGEPKQLSQGRRPEPECESESELATVAGPGSALCPVPGPVPGGLAFTVCLSGRRVRCEYHPRGESGAGRAQRRLLVLFDGEQWRRAGVVEATENDVLLIETGQGEARAGLLQSAALSTELVRLALAELERQTGRSRRPEDVTVAGASLGGLAATNAVVRAPELAGTAIALSPSLWVGAGQARGTGQGRLLQQLLAGEVPVPARARLLVGVGLHEGPTVSNCQHLVAAWQDAGARAEICFVRGGHDYAWWRYALTQALRAATGQ